MKTLYIYDSISLNCSHNKMFQTKAVEKIRTRILFSITFSSSENRTVYERMWKNIIELDRPQMATRALHAG